ncbi:phosphopantetheine binding protein [Paucimonas lemoignei]|uniref:Phosphopantetheine binding protein n=1 Tax=Paucimonas lemoignei TaxID=29443 RepID=A0A4R3I3S7_PAULE|nr:phosphopantetheine-binding protein [Paucimonas lemoignei]TCS38589.1 phosphopantetheine binding protein [Paucimonas lemoignei]
MQTIEETIAVLTDTLNLGERGKSLTAQSPLLGSVPELDSMAVIHLITALEDRFGISVEDDDISAATFETVGSLAAFVDDKLAQ